MSSLLVGELHRPWLLRSTSPAKTASSHPVASLALATRFLAISTVARWSSQANRLSLVRGGFLPGRLA